MRPPWQGLELPERQPRTLPDYQRKVQDREARATEVKVSGATLNEDIKDEEDIQKRVDLIEEDSLIDHLQRRHNGRVQNPAEDEQVPNAFEPR